MSWLAKRAVTEGYAVLDHAKMIGNAIDKQDIADAIERVAREFAIRAIAATGDDRPAYVQDILNVADEDNE